MEEDLEEVRFRREKEGVDKNSLGVEEVRQGSRSQCVN